MCVCVCVCVCEICVTRLYSEVFNYFSSFEMRKISLSFLRDSFDNARVPSKQNKKLVVFLKNGEQQDVERLDSNILYWSLHKNKDYNRETFNRYNTIHNIQKIH